LQSATPPLFSRSTDEGKEPRHGTRVSSLAEAPFNKPAPSRREALGLDKPEDFKFRDRQVLPVR